MPAPPAPGVIALEAIWVQEGQNVENTFHYHTSATIDEALLNAIMASYVAWATIHVGDKTNQCQLVKCQARDLTSSTGHSAILNVVPPVVGSSVGGPLPNNVTWCLKRTTGLRGRANRGRIYAIGIPADQLFTDKQQVGSTYANSLAANYFALMTSQLTTNGVQEVILHKALGTTTPVTNYVYADLYLDSQRRRLPGHNRHR